MRLETFTKQMHFKMREFVLFFTFCFSKYQFSNQFALKFIFMEIQRKEANEHDNERVGIPFVLHGFSNFVVPTQYTSMSMSLRLPVSFNKIHAVCARKFSLLNCKSLVVHRVVFIWLLGGGGGNSIKSLALVLLLRKE